MVAPASKNNNRFCLVDWKTTTSVPVRLIVCFGFGWFLRLYLDLDNTLCCFMTLMRLLGRDLTISTPSRSPVRRGSGPPGPDSVGVNSAQRIQLKRPTEGDVRWPIQTCSASCSPVVRASASHH